VDIVEQWVHKGDKLYVEGRLEYSQTQDDQGGTKYWTDIVVNEMVMLGGSGAHGGGGFSGGAPSGGSSAGGSFGGNPPGREADDDLPF